MNDNESRLPMQMRIGGILCDIKSDEDGPGFIDVFIATTNPRQKLLPEWIVRGAVTLKTAIAIAKRVIYVRLSGHTVFHDVEGMIRCIKDPTRGGEESKE
jgi:hypothetical protein